MTFFVSNFQANDVNIRNKFIFFMGHEVHELKCSCLYIFFLIKLNNFQILNTFVKTVFFLLKIKTL